MKPAPPAPDQLGPAIAYLAVKDGTPVYERAGSRVGVVEHVMAVGGIFKGIIIHTYPLPGRHLYADAGQIAELRERGVLLSVNREQLHDPSIEPARHSPDRREAGLEARVRRAWDWIANRV
ncbi:MAG TPA: hypothetical protein VGF81_18240 [Solirubrobacteraceae bacterium]